MIKKLIVPFVIVVAGVLLMFFLGSFKDEPEQVTMPRRAKVVDVKVADLRSVQTHIVAYGRLTSAQPVILYSEVSGELERGDVPFQPAQSFKKGDLLLNIDPRQTRLDLNSAKSDFLTALASVLPEIRVDFPQEYPRWQSYFDKVNFEENIPDLPETDNQKIKLFLARFNVYKLYFTVRNLEILLDKHYFRAPFDGSIVSTGLRVGSTARPGTRLGEIINLENLEVEIPVPSEDLQWLEREAKVSLTSSEIEGEWHGRIRRIGKAIDTRTQSVPVFITVDAEDVPELYEGIFLRADIPGKSIEKAATVPLQAIYDENFIYLIENGKLAYRKIGIARKELDTAIVTSGVQQGDTVIVEVMQGVAPGMPARAKAATNGRLE